MVVDTNIKPILLLSSKTESSVVTWKSIWCCCNAIYITLGRVDIKLNIAQRVMRCGRQDASVDILTVPDQHQQQQHAQTNWYGITTFIHASNSPVVSTALRTTTMRWTSCRFPRSRIPQSTPTYPTLAFSSPTLVLPLPSNHQTYHPMTFTGNRSVVL